MVEGKEMSTLVMHKAKEGEVLNVNVITDRNSLELNNILTISYSNNMIFLDSAVNDSSLILPLERVISVLVTVTKLVTKMGDTAKSEK